MTGTALTDADREVIRRATALGDVGLIDGLREHTGEQDETQAFIDGWAEARHLLAGQNRIIGRLAAAVENSSEGALAAVRAVLTRSLTEDTDGLGVLKRPQDDSAMLDRALRLINDLLEVLPSGNQPGLAGPGAAPIGLAEAVRPPFPLLDP